MNGNLKSRKRLPAFAMSVVLLLLVTMFVPSPCSSPLRAADDKQAVKVNVSEVVIDMVARDKKGALIPDLKENEVEVTEDGVKQKISSFRLVTSTTSAASSDPLQKVKLVTVVFERLNEDPEGQKTAKKALNEFFNAGLGDNVVVAIFVLGQRLNIVQQFTNKKEILQDAVDRAITQGITTLRANSDEIRNGLMAVANGLPMANPKPAMAGTGDTQLDARLAQLAIKMLSYTSVQDEGWRTTLYSIRSLAQGQMDASGRKIMLYFSSGIWMGGTENLAQLQTMISAANQSRVSIYPVYVRGLSMWSQASSTRDALQGASDASRSQAEKAAGGTGSGINSGEANSLQSGENATQSANALETMRSVAKDTAGMVMGESNDFRTPMRQVAEDINNFYEINYTPQKAEYDGKYRQTVVKVARTKNVFARNGYFAVPPSAVGGPMTLPYEAPLMTALNQPTPAHAFDYRLRLSYFENRNGMRRQMLMMEVPFINFTITEDAKAKKCRSQVAFMALFKDADGKVVEKVSDFYPFEWPLDRLDAIKKGNFGWIKQVQLPVGKYSVETVAYDKSTEKASIMKTSLEVPAANAGVQASSLIIIKRADQVAATDTDTSNPLRTGNQKIVPFVEDPVTLKVGDMLMLYQLIYSNPQAAAKPQMKLQLIMGGASLGEIPVELPAADAQGRIAYTGTLPTSAFPPGSYELKMSITQGDEKAESKANLTMVQ